MARLYINLPVSDLTKATAFYTALGFSHNQKFSNEQASAMVYDDMLSVMLLSHDFMRSFLPDHKSICSNTHNEVLNALQLDSKQEVDIFYHNAINAWWKPTIPVYDHWFMYGKDFEDLDGHIREVFWMDTQTSL